MIAATGLTKRYGAAAAVDGLTFAVKPGIITGFLGPIGAGKSTPSPAGSSSGLRSRVTSSWRASSTIWSSSRREG